MTERNEPGGDGGDSSGGRVVVVPDDGGTTDAAALWAIRTEARDSLDATIESIEAKDDKALSTVRINLVFVGFALTATSSVQSSLQFANWLTLLGFGSMLVSTVLGIATYSGTDYTPGIHPAFLRETRQSAYSEREWLGWMNDRYESWLNEALAGNRDEATILYWTHLTQAIGVVLLVLGFVAGVVGVSPPSFVPADGSYGAVLNAATFFCPGRETV